jgi:hypothetical protein
MANLRPLRTLSLLAVSLAAFAPGAAFADGVEEPRPPPVSAAPRPAPRANEPGPCVGDAAVGQVVAVAGAAYARAPGRADRALACDDPLRACEELVTTPGSSVAFLSGDVLVRVGGGSRVALDGAEGAPNLFLHDGSVRSTDGGAAGAAPVRLVTRDIAASASAADAELAAGGARPAQLCAFEGSAVVEAGAASRTLPAGQCFAAQSGGVASFAAGGAPSLGLEAPGFCAFAVALDDSLAPGDVAARPLDVFPGGEPSDDVPRDPCDEPGAGCNGGDGIGERFDDPEPVPGCDAPGVDCGGGKPGKGDDRFDDPDPVPGLDFGGKGGKGKGGKGRD